ncbi:MAG TPA: M50 family metallopeptidase, partial [Candidatus Ozemobacteraceae bacterium]|nr:M50 family metallopeptidase [Candidatus Ozemobacteraceae bacterium]
MTLTIAGWIGAILGFGFLVLIHEIGHFLALRWFGLPVYAFSVGFGSPLWKKQLGQTEYRLGWLPLGGYVMPEDPDVAEKREQEGGSLLPDHPPAAQFWVALAGPVANIVLGFVLFMTLMVGWGEPTPGLTVDSIVKGSPAAVAGLQPDDRLVSINGVTLKNWPDFIAQIQLNRQRSSLIGIERLGREIAIPITAVQEGERFVLGVRPRF